MMRSKSYKVDHLHEPGFNTPEEAPPPPPPQTEVSVPFMWEEAPGKPRRCHTQSEPNKNNSARTLELPPRLLFLEGKVSSNMEVPSPTTVLGGPYVGRAMSFSSSYRTPREYWNSNFGSNRWSGSRKINKETEDSLDFSCPITLSTPQPNKGKITKVHRRGSLISLSQPKARSHFWVVPSFPSCWEVSPTSSTSSSHCQLVLRWNLNMVSEPEPNFFPVVMGQKMSFNHGSKGSIYESFKHMVPWRRGQEKQRKWASKFDTV